MTIKSDECINVSRKPLIVRVGQGPLFISETKLIGTVANLNVWSRLSHKTTKKSSDSVCSGRFPPRRQLVTATVVALRPLLQVTLVCRISLQFLFHSGNMVNSKTSWNITGRLT